MEAQQTQLVQQGIKKEGFHITVTQMCITAVFMALTCVATMVVQIPIPLGYAHLGTLISGKKSRRRHRKPISPNSTDGIESAKLTTKLFLIITLSR